MQTEILKVSGMTCGGCTSKVTKALKGVNGVGDVDVSLADGEATVNFDERLASLEQLKSAVESAGYDLGEVSASHSHASKGGCCG